jgi:hypothetical protein
MMKEITFILDDDIDGGFNARAIDFSIFVQGDSLSEIIINIRYAIRCHFGIEETIWS